LNVYSNLGFGFGKFLDDKGNRVIFPSVAGELQITAFDGEFSGGLGITTEDGLWLFGQSALDQSAQSFHQQRSDWILSAEYRAGILLAITELTRASRVDVTLSIALPYATPAGMRSKLRDRLTGEHLVKRHQRDSQRICIDFSQKHSFIPENIAPTFFHLLNQHGNVNRLDSSGTIYVGCINVGSHTVELSTAIINLNTSPIDFDLVRPQNQSESGGMYSLTRSIQPLLRERFYGQKDKFTAHEIFEIIRTDTVGIGNQRVDVSDITALPRISYQNRLMNLCSNNWSSESPHTPADLYAFIVSGGGAYIIAPYLKKFGFHNNILVSDDPQWDVPRGMKRLHRMLEKSQ